MSPDGYAHYQQNSLLTASPAKLLLAAYDGAIRFCRIAIEKMDNGNHPEMSVNINKALAIVCELLSTLNDDANPPLVARLKSIYLYMIERLAHANLNEDRAAVEEVTNHLLKLRETWAEADRIIVAEQQVEKAA